MKRIKRKTEDDDNNDGTWMDGQKKERRCLNTESYLSVFEPLQQIGSSVQKELLCLQVFQAIEEPDMRSWHVSRHVSRHVRHVSGGTCNNFPGPPHQTSSMTSTKRYDVDSPQPQIFKQHITKSTQHSAQYKLIETIAIIAQKAMLKYPAINCY